MAACLLLFTGATLAYADPAAHDVELALAASFVDQSSAVTADTLAFARGADPLPETATMVFHEASANEGEPQVASEGSHSFAWLLMAAAFGFSVVARRRTTDKTA